MVGSIDPRCETVRGTHWPKAGRRCVWSSRRGKPSWPAVKTTASTGRTYGCKRSDQTRKKLLWHGGRTRIELASRKTILASGQDDRINRPDIWMQAIRSDQKKTLVARGPSTYGSRLCGAARSALHRVQDTEAYAGP